MPRMHDNVLVWGEIEDATIDQAARLSRMPFVTGHVALMPDAHVGMGSTIGTVFGTRGAIIPAAIGVDIGCGMVAQFLGVKADELPDNLNELHHAIARSIPAGMGQGHRGDHRDDTTRTTIEHLIAARSDWNEQDQRRAYSQFGSLGSGNHFVEICLDENDDVWAVLHSGSRGIGNALATKHIECAKGLMRQYFIELEDPDLAYLVEGTDEFNAYIGDMRWAQEYAFANRQAMIDEVVRQVAWFLGRTLLPEPAINCHHNYTVMEHHGGKDVWLTRKGAIRARSGDLGVIPGSMGAKSYIVRGRGSVASYTSSSHGAGRRLSRMEARRSLSVDSLNAEMAGKTWNAASAEALLDEHPDAYKPIAEVMEAQTDLVEVVHELRQIVNYKGVEEVRRKGRAR
ncbi:RtcB family protein [Ferrimicrobium sp.]|uniref:RtcB family protein n=1 Tax=Ferrimicrobium sp. TaxID=2926050 RepID=UPI00262FA1C5|nr:RtcB family protein [Ferrimicrobium sp.]